ncbi:MAG: flippase-like domain-containing protein [Anaerolineales bacterium]|nr:flippase-like domain-containing protein [Anaerolineales bacterium]MCB9126400.1 flippase-like domain-containing protein [Ardenticatenales bacterium]MCB9171561.1 flippase-like domain-containing protein [Ardenticatenales bacterium]
MMRKRLIIAFGLVVSAFFLWLTLRDQAWGEVAAAFGQADYRWLLPAALLIMVDYLIRGWRWQIILRPILSRPLPLGSSFSILLLGFAANNVLPARAGELWRMWGLSQRADVRKTVVLSTLVVERLFDGLTLLFLLALSGLLFPLQGQAQMVETALAALFGVVLLGLLAFLFFEDQMVRLATLLMWPFPHELRERLLGLIDRFTDGLHALRRPRALLAIVFTSLLAWGSQALSYAAILLAFGLRLDPLHLLGVATLMLALINLLILIPAAPGNVGTYEGGGRLALSIAGIAALRGETGTAIILVSHMLQWLLVTAGGLIIAAQQGISLARVPSELSLAEE